MDINTVLYLGATRTQIRYFLSLLTALEAFIPSLSGQWSISDIMLQHTNTPRARGQKVHQHEH